ncbi:Methyltransferase [Alloactinosynnema sp. L-07]|uniref:class I SAM-dependent methyltransferase n=1 Tax=Alloactinosynnema sp. L-07 TaxID=1653480 RepID=UPI00065F083B|nr:class I SAM-dependent methyltransferase [Alloactinosynnema sp. L-07]CRK56144.1 Methyltransferase [Alloactinosynnema sp. L-07]
MVTPTQAWDRFAQRATPRRAANAAGATSWLNWTQYPDHGPDESVLGLVDGKRVVELGSGSGDNLAHLVSLGATGVGVDIAPSRTAVATTVWGHLSGVDFVTADAADYLAANLGGFDIVYSIFGALWFTDPKLLLPRVRDALVPGGVLVFSHLPACAAGQSVNRVITQHHLSAELWVNKLLASGFERATANTVASPTTAEDQRGTLLVRAYRPDADSVPR